MRTANDALDVVTKSETGTKETRSEKVFLVNTNQAEEVDSIRKRLKPGQMLEIFNAPQPGVMSRAMITTAEERKRIDLIFQQASKKEKGNFASFCSVVGAITDSHLFNKNKLN